MAPRYGLLPGVRIVFLDDEAVIFNPSSWETHLLNAASALVVESLQRQSLSVSDVEQLLAEALADAEKPFARQHAESVLSELSSLTLVAAVDPTHATG